MSYIKLGIVVLALSAIITIPILINKLQEANRQLKEIGSYVANKDAQIEYYKNSRAQEVAKKEATVMALNALQKVSEDKDLAFLKELEGIKKNLRNLEVATSINTKTITSISGNLSDTTVTIDSVVTPAFTFNLQNEWFTHTGHVVPSIKSITIISEVEVPIEGAIYWERPKLFGFGPRWFTKKKYQTELTSRNPYTRITQADQILIRRK